MVAVKWRGAEEKRAANNIVSLSGFRVDKRSVLRQIQELPFVVTDKSNRFLKRVDGLNGSPDKLLHGFETAINFNHFRFLFGPYK